MNTHFELPNLPFRNQGKKHSQENPKNKDSENSEKKPLPKKIIVAISAGAIGLTLTGAGAAWGFSEASKQSDVEAQNPSKAQTETIADDQTDNIDSSSISSVTTPEIEVESKYSKYSDWSVGKYENIIDNLESSTVDVLSKQQILVPGNISQSDLIKLSSFYIDENINNGLLYSVIGNGHLMSLPGYREPQQEALSQTADTPEKGQAMLDSIYNSKRAAYSIRGKESMVILASTYIAKSIGGDEIITPSACADAITQINKADSEYEKTGVGTAFKDPGKIDWPKFSSFVETIPEMTDYAGNKYKDGKLIEFTSNNSTSYMLIAIPAEKQYDYSGDEIVIPIEIGYGKTPEEVLNNSTQVVIY